MNINDDTEHINQQDNVNNIIIAIVCYYFFATVELFRQ